MKLGNKGKIAILVLALLGLVALFYYLYPSSPKTTKKKEEGVELYKKFMNKDGLHILKEMLNGYPKIDSMKFVKDNLDTSLNTAYSKDTNRVYMLIDRDIDISPRSVDTLIKFIQNGNTAFVAVNKFNAVFMNKISYSSLTYSYYSDEVSLDFTHPDFKMDYSYKFQLYENNIASYRQWNYLSFRDMFTEVDEITTLGVETYRDNPIFIKFPMGKGTLYLHAIPEVFYNESMFSEDGLEYAQRVFSHFPKGNYYWHNHINRWDDKSQPPPFPPEEIEKKSPIQYILKDRYLRHAYLLLIFGLLVYVAFKIKRKQRIIPTVEPNTNSSLEFVDTVSLLYLKQDKHYKFIRHYEQSFIHFIKDKYYISSPEINKEYIESVSLKSDIGEELITQIFNEFNRAKKSHTFSSDELIALHRKIEYFYKHCK